MKQHEAVIKVMEQNGGFSTLGFLNQEVLKVPGVEWKTKTPFASIRRIVQDGRYFFKIKPGLWALLSHKDNLPQELLSINELPKQEQIVFNHSYFQGLLVEIGNLKGYKTSIPPQDKNKKYLNKALGDLSQIKEPYEFSYSNLVKRAKTVDVTWFNERRMPNSFFEIEYSTNIQNSLLKFFDFQDFSSKFFIVADEVRHREFDSKIRSPIFSPIIERVRFLNYDKVADWHTKVHESVILEKEIFF